ncbi:MAG: hypothetical protein KDC85_24440 [Saprospiraceae bacterium]|nr:hypothetical protein [Saprospiraceae bacterium]
MAFHRSTRKSRKSSQRTFEIGLHQPADTGPTRSDKYIKCATCDTKEFVNSSGRSLLPDEVVQQKLQRRGWLVGKTWKHDKCPSCVAIEAKAKETMKTKETTNVTQFPSRPAEPRKITRDDRRLIFDKLNEVYDNGYTAGWTDKKLAEDLGVPAAWVEEVRAEFFGDANTNEEITDFLARYDAAVAEAGALRDKVVEVSNKLDELLKLGRQIKESL